MWRRGFCKGRRELMKTGKESTGKGGFSQVGEQTLPQKLIAAAEVHALKGLLHALTPEALVLLLQNCCCFVQRHFNQLLSQVYWSKLSSSTKFSCFN